MNYPSFKYIDTAIEGVNKRNNVQDITQFKNFEGKVDCYRTVFRFDESYLQHFQANHSVAGYHGKCYADFIPIDIDAENLIDAYVATKEAIQILRLDYEYDVQYLFFSGKKGFHILLPSECFGIFEPSENLPKIFKSIMQDIYPQCDLAIYDINRLFRLNNTKHSVSDLYKISLTIPELNEGIEKILLIAKTTRKTAYYPFSDNVKNEQFIELYKKHKAEKKPLTKEAKSIYQDFAGVGVGERDVTATRICGILKAKNMESELTLQIMKGWNLQNTPPLEESQLVKIINSVYRYDEKGIDNDIIPIWAIYDEYEQYVKSEKKVNIGIPEIDEKIRGVRPGQVMTIMGFTGNFKTATLQNILRHYHSYAKEPVLMFEMEMPRLDLFERAVQIEMNIGGKEVEEMFHQNENDDKSEVIQLLQMRLKDFYVVDRPGLTLQLLEKYIKQAEEKIYKRKTGLVGVDFIQLMHGNGSTTVQIVNDISKEMKNVAKRLNVPIIMVSQVTGVEDSDDKINMMSARDSKSIPIMSDYVIGLWLKEGDENTQIVKLLKNRKGGLREVERKINRRTLTFDYEETEYKSPF